MSTSRVILRGKKAGRYELLIVDPDEFVTRIGPRLATAFFKCFAGVDRVFAFDHFRFLNGERVASDSVAYDRNLRTVFFMLASAMYEIGSALQELCNAKIVEKMKDRRPWEPLNELRGNWYTDRVAGILRNQVGHHLGEREHWEKGLRTLAGMEELVIGRGDSDDFHDIEFEGARDVLYRGLGVDEAAFKKLVVETQDAYRELPALLVTAFTQVAETAGIAVRDERT